MKYLLKICLYLLYSFLNLWQGVNNTFLKFEFFTFILFLIILNIEIVFIFRYCIYLPIYGWAIINKSDGTTNCLQGTGHWFFNLP